jgi:hypothetical protein
MQIDMVSALPEDSPPSLSLSLLKSIMRKEDTLTAALVETLTKKHRHLTIGNSL